VDIKSFGITKIRSFLYSESPRFKSCIGNRPSLTENNQFPPFCPNQLSTPLKLDYNSFLS